MNRLALLTVATVAAMFGPWVAELVDRMQAVAV